MLTRQAMCNIEEPSRIIVAVEKQYLKFLGVGERASVRACVYVRVALLMQHATCMRHVTSIVAPLAQPNFSRFSHKRHDFLKNVIEHKTCALIFSTTFI
jgi:hypothetical protein